MLASSSASVEDGPYPLDHIRLQKALFLISKRGPERWRDAYEYVPYDWGPYSSELLSDVNRLRLHGLMRVRPVDRSRYGTYTLTDRGEAVADDLWGHLSSDEQRFMVRVRSYVTSQSFNKLLREVYAAYPEYASKSRFRG